MKVLWLTNNLLPDISDYLQVPVINKTGWLHSAANQIKSSVELYVAALYDGTEIKVIELNGIRYIIVPKQTVVQQSMETWTEVCKLASPDVIHIHGTEYPTGLGLIKAYDPDRIVVSIQGLILEIAKYYNFGISDFQILRHTTIRDIIKRDTLWHQKRRFVRSGNFEREYLRNARNFIGRTEWDKAHVLTNNPKAKYFFNNETIRDSFYDKTWEIDNIERHTIFFSQGTYPMKGFHQLLNALPIILEQYPDTKIKIAGFDITKTCSSSVVGRVKGTTYGLYLRSIIKRLGLSNHIIPLGNIPEKDMRNAYLKSHLYVNASALENSSNSIGEAQLLGVPVVASYVGGTDSIVSNNETGLLYPANDIVRLASCIMRIFEDDNLALKLSKGGREVALDRHDKQKNREKLMEIYEDISRHKTPGNLEL